MIEKTPGRLSAQAAYGKETLLIKSSLTKEAFLLDLPGEKEGAIRAAVGSVAKVVGLSADSIFASVMEREQIMSTGMGHGVAIPHAKVTGLDRFYVSICRSSQAINYNSLDSTPVRILALLLSPEDRTKDHVKMIADITKRLKFSSVRQAILDAKTVDELETAILTAI